MTLNFNERKRKHDLRTIWKAIIYFVKAGCQWRFLPDDFPRWQLVYYCYSKWANADSCRWRLQRRSHRTCKMKFGYLINVLMRSNEKKTDFKPISKRWIVERTFAWFYNDRRLCRNC